LISILVPLLINQKDTGEALEVTAGADMEEAGAVNILKI
jgi:hypothetical protein